jgi:hypothetical protein
VSIRTQRTDAATATQWRRTSAHSPHRSEATPEADEDQQAAARHLRDLLLERPPRARIPPELRAQVRLRKTLVDQRTEWLQRIQRRFPPRRQARIAPDPATTRHQAG